jgi:hypothetical protein
MRPVARVLYHFLQGAMRAVMLASRLWWASSHLLF